MRRVEWVVLSESGSEIGFVSVLCIASLKVCNIFILYRLSKSTPILKWAIPISRAWTKSSKCRWNKTCMRSVPNTEWSLTDSTSPITCLSAKGACRSICTSMVEVTILTRHLTSMVSIQAPLEPPRLALATSSPWIRQSKIRSRVCMLVCEASRSSSKRKNQSIIKFRTLRCAACIAIKIESSKAHTMWRMTCWQGYKLCPKVQASKSNA